MGQNEWFNDDEMGWTKTIGLYRTGVSDSNSGGPITQPKQR